MKDNIKNSYELLKQWFWALPLWKRVIMTSLIGSFGGSTIVGFINKYALYYYAINQASGIHTFPIIHLSGYFCQYNKKISFTAY